MRLKSTLFIGVAALLMSLPLLGCNKSTDGSGSDPVVEMTESYRKAREDFKKVTNIELPALANLEVEDFPYEEGILSYCFDITSGSALNYQTYMIFENFFLETIGQYDEGYPRGDEASDRDAEWIDSEYRCYQTYWDNGNHAIYINTEVVY